MEAKKRNILSTLLRVGFKKIEISKQLNVSRMTVHRVEQRLKASESLMDRPRPGRPQVISQEAIKMDIEDDPCQKISRQAQRRQFPSPLCPE